MTGAHIRTCDWCGTDITDRAPDALYCSKRCGSSAAAKRFRFRNPGYYARWRYPRA